MPKRKTGPRPQTSAKGTSSKLQQGEYCAVLTTCGSRREAIRIARDLVSKRLAACINISGTPVRSVYRWKGKIEQAHEFLLLIKTSKSRLAALQAAVVQLHSYEVPEFLVLLLAGGSEAYLAWLDDCLKSSPSTRANRPSL